MNDLILISIQTLYISTTVLLYKLLYYAWVTCELTSQEDSVGGKNFAVLMSMQVDWKGIENRYLTFLTEDDITFFVPFW